MKHYLRYCLAFFLATFALASFSQPINTLYFLRNAPENNQLNPAFQPNFKFYLGLPALSGTQFNVGNNSLNLNDLLYYNKKIDSLVWFLNPDYGSKDDFIKSLKNMNKFQFETQIDLFNLGFSINDWYAAFNITQKANFSIDYPKAFAEFCLDLLEAGKTYDMADLGFNYMVYTEYGFGLSKKVGEQWQFGAKAKLLMGQSTMQAKFDRLNLGSKLSDASSTSNISVDAQATVDMSVPFLEMNYGENGYPDSTSNFHDPSSASDYTKLAFNPKNSGLAFDLGVIYKPIDYISLSASVIDLGRIWWKDTETATSFSVNGAYKFEGVDLNMDKELDMDSIMTEMTDSIKDNIKASHNNDGFSTALPTKIFIGGEFMPTNWLSIGILSRTTIYSSYTLQEFTTSLNLNPLRMFSTSISYSFNNNNFSSIGLGFGTRLGPCNSYIAFDHIPLKYGKQFVPYKASSFEVRFGVNFVLGNRDRVKKKNVDKPLFDE
jgi:hypothetical protein